MSVPLVRKQMAPLKIRDHERMGALRHAATATGRIYCTPVSFSGVGEILAGLVGGNGCHMEWDLRFENSHVHRFDVVYS